MKNHYIKLLFKLFIIITILECIYLFAVPVLLEKFVQKDFINNLADKNTNAIISFSKPKIKTHIKPELTLKFDNLNIIDKENQSVFLNADNINTDISLLPLFLRKLHFKHINAGDLKVNIQRDKDGNFNIDKLFPNKNKKTFTLKYKNSKLHIKNFEIKSDDELIGRNIEITGSPLYIKTDKKQNISIQTNGKLNTNGDLSDFEIDLQTNYPITKDFNRDSISGKCFIYNLNLNPFMPFVKQYIVKDITKFEGFIDFIQFSSNKTEQGRNQIILNTKFNNFVFDKDGWKNYIYAQGENKFDTNIELYDKEIDIKSLNYKADKINLKSNGSITLEQKPILNINLEVENSRAENIVSILPPNLAPQYMIIEKVKSYGVFGDVNGKVNFKGRLPQPDITGFIKAKNVKILYDKSIHPLHDGTVDITFDKRILNMNIDVDMFNKQKANINGYIYMFRDGINNVTIKTTNNVDFPLAQKIVIPISKVFNFQLGPIPDMDITSGKGIIDVNVQGSIDYININGYCEFDKAQLTYNGLSGEIKNGKGRLDFKEDTVSFNSERAFVKNNPLHVDGIVTINKDLDFNISSDKAEAKDLLELINNSSLLKDVKDGIAIITEAKGITELFVNIKSKIVPVEYGQPPLPPEEAFEDMKVKGSLYLFDNSCFIEGFYTPVEKIKGIVDFTETIVNINNIEGVSGTSPIIIGGKVINDLETKIPDVDITITGKSINLKDTIKFLTESYLYPKDYPDLSPLYNIASKHDLYFKYKAKSVDFVTDKAYAVINFIKDDTQSPLKAKSGKIIMDKAAVKVENVIAELFDRTLKINGDVQKIDTLNPIYNLKVSADNFNLENLNNTEKIEIMPEEAKKFFNLFKNYQGFANINLELNKNILNGTIQLIKPRFEHITTGIPFIFGDFNIDFKNNKVSLNDVDAQIASMPFFGSVKIDNIYKTDRINGYFTLRITDNFIKNYLPGEISKRISLLGNVNLAADFTGSINNFEFKPKLTLYPEADVIIDGASLGEINDKREYNGKINISKNKIEIEKLDYVKYVSSQNNTVYPILFASGDAVFNIGKDNMIEPEEINIKTFKNLSAKVLNIFLKNPVLKQGTFNCDLKYKFNALQKTAKLQGQMDCKNLDIPLFDTIVKNIRLKTENDNIVLHLFGFMNDSKIDIFSEIENNIYSTPEIHSLKVYADKIDTDKLLVSLSKTRKAMNVGNEIKNIDFSGIHIKDGYINVKEYTFKALAADDFITNFSIDENGILSADDINVNVGQGNIKGKFSYDLMNNIIKGDFELANVDSNYFAQSLFDGHNQIYGNGNGKIILETKGLTEEEIIKNLCGFLYFDISDGRMPKLGSLEYLLRASNILKSGITGLSLNSILELLNLVKTGYFSNINGSCVIENGIAKNIEIFSKGENLSLYIHGSYDISKTNADMEVLGKLSRKISTIFGAIGNTSLNTFFKLIPGISILDFSRDNFIEDVEKIPSFTNGDYESRTFQAIINGNINDSGYVQSFKWVK